MNKQSYTKEERYLIAAYQILEEGAVKLDQVDKYKIGEMTNLSTRAVNAISHQLVRSNFFKKKGEVDIAITPTGIKVAKSLLHPGEV